MGATSSIYADLASSPEPTQVSTQYVWGARPNHRDELVLRDRDTSGDGVLEERLYSLMDYFDPVAVVDREGSVVERYAWSAFGLRTVMGPDWSPQEWSEFEWSFGFHGQFLDGETGYYNYGFRYYSPQIGRWLSKDPIEESGGVNLYAFAGNSPGNKLDLYGLIECQVDSFGLSVISWTNRTVQFEGGTQRNVFLTVEFELILGSGIKRNCCTITQYVKGEAYATGVGIMHNYPDWHYDTVPYMWDGKEWAKHHIFTIGDAKWDTVGGFWSGSWRAKWRDAPGFRGLKESNFPAWYAGSGEQGGGRFEFKTEVADAKTGTVVKSIWWAIRIHYTSISTGETAFYLHP